jgi:peptidoglycan hydrolase CwlO-like protein
MNVKPVDWTSRFIGVCTTIITAATLGIFSEISDLNKTVATIQAQTATNSGSIAELKNNVSSLQAALAEVNLELVRVKAMSESWVRRVKKQLPAARDLPED